MLLPFSSGPDIPYRKQLAASGGAGVIGTRDGEGLQNLLDYYNGNARSLRSFGALGDGSVEETAIAAAFAWLNGARGRALLVPATLSYKFCTDKIVTQSNSAIIGVGMGRSTLAGQNNARIIFGIATTNGVDATSGLPIKSTTGLVQNCLLYNLNITPAGAHSGECVLIDSCNDMTIELCNIGPTVNDGTTIVHGVKTNWVQWFYFRRNNVSVNGACLYVMQPATYQLQNEDHFHIMHNRMYTAKILNEALFPPTLIYIDIEEGRKTGIFEFSIIGNHMGRFPASDTASQAVRSGGITIKYRGTAASYRTFHSLNVSDNMWEYVDYPVDFKRQHATLDESHGRWIGNTHISPRGIVFNAGDYSKTSFDVGKCYFLQGVSLVDGVLLNFVGQSDISSFTGTVFVTAISRHRFWNKMANACLVGYRMKQNLSVAVAQGATYVDITYTLPDVPRIFSYAHYTGSTWTSTFSPYNVTATTARIYFSAAAPAATTLYITVEVAEI